MTTRLTKQKLIRRKEWGVDARAVNNAINTNWVDVNGFNQLTLYFNWQSPGAATQLVFNIQGTFPKYWDRATSSTEPQLPPYYVQIQGTPVVVDPVVTAVPLTVIEFRKVRGPEPEHQWILNLPINYPLIRLWAVEAVGGGPTDLLTIDAVVAYL